MYLSLASRATWGCKCASIPVRDRTSVPYAPGLLLVSSRHIEEQSTECADSVDIMWDSCLSTEELFAVQLCTCIGRVCLNIFCLVAR